MSHQIEMFPEFVVTAEFNPADDYNCSKPTAPTSTYPTKSAHIRALSAEGWSRGAIAKELGIRYQHVRNVLLNPPKKA